MRLDHVIDDCPFFFSWIFWCHQHKRQVLHREDLIYPIYKKDKHHIGSIYKRASLCGKPDWTRYIEPQQSKQTSLRLI